MSSSGSNGTSDKRPMVGGQAVLEGVMMRSPWRLAVAVRNPKGEIITRSAPFKSITKRVKVLGFPVIRGAVGLFEAMKMGMGALSWSAEIAEGENEKKKSKAAAFWEMLLTIVLSVVLAVGLFMLVPYAAAEASPIDNNPFLFHLIAGGLRIALLIGYMLAISLIPDITRVFQYHGAEHKSIFTWEKLLTLEVSNAAQMSRFHPRCGTSFLLLAAVMTMIGFALFDAVWVTFIGDFRNIFTRLLIHLPVIPIVAGLSYEVLRLVEKHAEDKLWQPLVKPGFWLQKITTREPDEGQLEVALHSLRESLIQGDEVYEGPAREEAVPDSAQAEPVVI
ncbi:MAG TPA: DUF1385 domain-containing protein [Bacteroidetes bacterium]|nr:hypothetical protein BMS3Bbin04_00598 [bacterium BMS3Bbin04]HDO66037.1 DUF1385 domain-containing protein [Bacteroidota bacterium]HEX05162.1 DUF1385 domain-containing protein [Bacteroidota bacterium]